MALLTGAPRTATVVALSPGGRCLALEKASFDRVVGPLKRLVEMTEQRSMLNNIAVLKNLSELERLNAVRRFKLATYKAGTVSASSVCARERERERERAGERERERERERLPAIDT
jgi:CRP-like cAMP-binding protein